MQFLEAGQDGVRGSVQRRGIAQREYHRDHGDGREVGNHESLARQNRRERGKGDDGNAAEDERIAQGVGHGQAALGRRVAAIALGEIRDIHELDTRQDAGGGEPEGPGEHRRERNGRQPQAPGERAVRRGW